MNSCQSCGMPLEENTTSKHDSRYCIYCQNQDTSQLATYDQVRRGTIDATVKFMGKTLPEATQMADEQLPTLPRWQQN